MAVVLQSSNIATASRARSTWPALLVAASIITIILHAIPLAGAYLLTGHVADVMYDDDRVYLSRLLDAAKGGSLSNPYIIEDQNRPKYMPAVTERVLGTLSQWSKVDVRWFAAGSRMVFPLMIFLLTVRLARELEVRRAASVMAGLLLTLMPSFSNTLLQPSLDYAGYMGFLRYERLISPSSHLILFLVWALGLARVWRRGGLFPAMLAGAGLGALVILLPPYYWTFAIAAAAVLCLGRERRSELVLLLALGIVIGFPSLLEYHHLNSLTDVQETLTRVEAMTRTHSPNKRSLGLAFGTSLLAAAIWRRRHALGRKSGFLLPLFCVAALLLLQTVVTGLEIQNDHWMYAVLPFVYIALAALWEIQPEINRRAWYVGMGAFLVCAAFLSQGFALWVWHIEREDAPEIWDLESRIPATISWIRGNTPLDSVLLARDDDTMEMLYIQTGRKVYWSAFAGQHVVGEREANLRTAAEHQWDPRNPQPLSYRADYFLGNGSDCLHASPGFVLFRDAVESTCLMRIPKRIGR